MQLSLSSLGKQWLKRSYDQYFAGQIKQYFGTSDLLSNMIAGRLNDISEVENFLSPKIKTSLPDPFHLKDMQKAVSRAYEAVIHKERIVIFADYDVDGATSSALLKNFFADIGVAVEIYVPDRIIEGYGPNAQAMEKLAARNTKLVITVDCGSVAFEAINCAVSLGMDVIVIDHHISLDILPAAVAIINPNRLDEDSNCKNLAAVGVAFLFLVAIVKYFTAKNLFTERNIQVPNLMQYLDLVALGTVCDMMHLTGVNRAFVAQGIKIGRQRSNIGYRQLCDVSGINDSLNCYHLGFLLGPRVNAGGRVGQADLGARLLSCRNSQEAHHLALELDKYNEERKVLEMLMLQEADVLAAAQINDPMLFVMKEGWHPGVIGIIAGRLKEKYNKPVAVIAMNNGVGKASCRSVRGVDFGTALLKAKQQELLIAGGGHAMAAGFTVEQENLALLRNFLSGEFAAILANSSYHLHEYYDLDITTAAINEDLMEEIAKLEPFGYGNPEPVFRCYDLYVLKAYIVGAKNIRVIFAPQKNSVSKKTLAAIAFNAVGTELENILMSKNPHNCHILGKLKINRWQNTDTIQMHLQDIIIDP
jgi:single-stranded-DNA-specific exonuclease